MVKTLKYITRKRFQFTLAFLLFCNPVFCFIKTKRFDAKPVPRSNYLTNFRPPALHYSDPVKQPDRRVLLSLPPLVTEGKPTIIDVNLTEPVIPVLAYEEDENPSYTQSAGENLTEKLTPKLPEPDPFIESAPPATYNSTDDLLDIFEQSSREAAPYGFRAIPFVPPFTNAPDNLRVESEATYRKVRK